MIKLEEEKYDINQAVMAKDAEVFFFYNQSIHID